MSSSRALAAASVLLAGALSLPAQPAVGTRAPDLELGTVLQAPAPFTKLGDLRGSAVLLEFWATWCGPCKAQIPHMNERHKEYADRGLFVLAVSSEPQATVEPFVAQNGMTYAVGLDGGAAMAAYGVRGVPHALLIDKDGVVRWSGHPAQIGSAAIEDVLIGATPFGARLAEQLAPVQMLLDVGQKGRALAMLRMLVADGKLAAAPAKQAAATVARLERESAARLDRAEKLASGGALVEAAWTLRRARAEFEGCDAGTSAQERLAKVAETPAGKRAVDLAEQMHQAQTLVARQRTADAVAALEALVASQDAFAAPWAQRALERLRPKADAAK